MKTDESSGHRPEDIIFAESIKALLEERYQNALEISMNELDQAFEKAYQYDSFQLLHIFSLLLSILERQLREAYGESWEEQVEIPKVPEKEIVLSCSFCGKSNAEVAKLIAGPAVYICNECIDICNEIIEDDKKYKERMNEQSNE